MGTSRVLEEAKRQTLFFSYKSFEANARQFFAVFAEAVRKE